MQHSAVKTKVVVNGREIATSASTIADLVVEQGLSDVKIATALNGHFVAEARRATTALTTGDRVEIVSARQGG